MDTNCDSTTIEILRRIVGLQMQSVYAHRYPGYGAYDAVIATFGGGMTIRMDLRDHTISPKFEVFVLRVRPADLPTALDEWDHILIWLPKSE